MSTDPTLIRNAVVLPVEPPGALDRGWVRLAGGRIAALGEGEPVVRDDDVVLDAGGALVIPGLVSAHQHLLDVLLRGGVDYGPEFLDWLLGLYYAGMTQYTPQDAGLATLLAGSETLLAGITCVVDNWGVDCGSDRGRTRACAEASLSAYRSLGLRVVFARMFATALPESWTAWAQAREPGQYDTTTLTAPLDRCLGEISDLMREHDRSGDGRIRVAPAPELVELVGVDGMREALALATDHGVRMPVHLLTSPAVREQYPLAGLADAGALTGSVLAAHCTQASDGDLALLAQVGVGVAHCPTSNAFGGAAISVRRFLDAGIDVGVGSDNATLNCSSDVLAEARRALLTARIADPAAPRLTGWDGLELATISGARAIGLGEEIGSLLPGKRADLVMIDTSGPHWWPRHDWAQTLLFQGRASDVDTVMVDGHLVVAGGRVLALDGDLGSDLHPRAQRASEAVMRRAGLRAPAVGATITRA